MVLPMKKTRHLILALVLLIIAQPSFAQKDQKEVTWKDSLLGVWQLDCTEEYGHYGQKRIWKNDQMIIRLYKVGMVARWDYGEQDVPSLHGYEILEGEKSRWLNLEGDGVYFIDTLTSTSLVYSYRNGTLVYWYYFSKRNSEPSLALTLVGEYLSEDTGLGWTVYPPLSAVPGTLLQLDSSGKMKHSLGSPDSGSWELTDDLVLELNGTRKQIRFSVNRMNAYELDLHPLGTKEDSLLFLDRIHRARDLMQGVDDSIRVADSLAAVMAQMEADMDASLYQRWISSGTWKSGQNNDTELILLTDSTFIYRQGRKKYKGTLSVPVANTYGAQGIPISLDGREQIMLCHVKTAITNMDTELEVLTITFVPPGSKKLQTITFSLQR